MLKSSSKKGQFFIMTSVMIVGVFFTLSKYVNQYSFIDTSAAAEGAEIMMFENIRDKAIKTVQISDTNNINGRLNSFADFVERVVAARGYTLAFNYTTATGIAVMNMSLMSQKYTLRSGFQEPIPLPTTTTTTVP